MTRQELFHLWAPPDATWSSWAKPVLFSDLWTLDVPPVEPACAPWLPPADGATALVLDLGPEETFSLAAAIHGVGYRLVPLYNAVRGPAGGYAAVDTAPLLSGLAALTPRLRANPVPPNAPPAFLLDRHRREGRGHFVAAGRFDNRSVSLPTDFPSANRLLAEGIRSLLLIQPATVAPAPSLANHGVRFFTRESRSPLHPQPDLAHTLLRYQQAGLAVASLTLDDPTARPVEIERPPRFRSLLHRFIETLGLRPNALGGYGGTLPIPSSAG